MVYGGEALLHPSALTASRCRTPGDAGESRTCDAFRKLKIKSVICTVERMLDCMVAFCLKYFVLSPKAFLCREDGIHRSSQTHAELVKGLIFISFHLHGILTKLQSPLPWRVPPILRSHFGVGWAGETNLADGN